ncbi:hypothetical protein HMPREF1575_00149 [Gardnerella vaginalis JCP7672]|nr:hypothetical protein HMPREF1575_00149 [Gardnerella vaginalis JCP7672]
MRDFRIVGVSFIAIVVIIFTYFYVILQWNASKFRIVCDFVVLFSIKLQLCLIIFILFKIYTKIIKN